MWHSIESPSASHVWSCGSLGSTLLVMMLTGARPSMALSRSRSAEDNASYRAVSRMSSMASTTTASTPGSPTHIGVKSLGESGWG